MTKLTYFDSPWTYEGKSTVKAVRKDADGRSVVMVEATLFYPQGGGQPYDQGIMESASSVFAVEAVRYIEGTVEHYGQYVSGGPFAAGDEVTCRVDVARRLLNSRLHSAGHMIDYALVNLGIYWEPHKGHHHPDGSYDEFKAPIDTVISPDLAQKVEVEVNRLIEKGAAVSFKIVTLDELRSMCRFVPPFLPKDKPSRAAIYHFPAEEGGDKAIPCGGTHVHNLKEIGLMSIPKIKCKDGIVKISYRLV